LSRLYISTRCAQYQIFDRRFFPKYSINIIAVTTQDNNELVNKVRFPLSRGVSFSFFYLLHKPAKSTDEVHLTNCIRDSTTPFQEYVCVAIVKPLRGFLYTLLLTKEGLGVVALCLKESDDKFIDRISEQFNSLPSSTWKHAGGSSASMV
jgi:hypothetical protein